MPTSLAITPAPASLTPAASAVKAQFADPPDLEAMARTLLSRAIVEKYPSLTIDLTHTKLAVPRDTLGWDLQPFFPMVLDYLGNGTALDFTPRNNQPYFLCDDPPHRLAPADGTLDMNVIKEVVEELTWRLPISLQNALSDFWSAASNTGISRWLWLSHMFRDNLTISVAQQPDLTNDTRSAIQQLIDYPERRNRLAQYGSKAARAYLLKATLSNGGERSGLSSIMLIESPGQLLCWFQNGQIGSFRSWDSFTLAWGTRMGISGTVKSIYTKRFEIDGDVFEARSAAELNQQLESLIRLKLPASIGWYSLQTVYKEIADPSVRFLTTAKADPQTLATLEQHLPDWLKKASLSDQARYRQFSLALASTKKNHQGKTFLSDIADIHVYTVEVLHQLLRRDLHKFEPDAKHRSPEDRLAPNDIELTFHTVTGLPGTIGIEERVHMSLTELALKNLMGLPTGRLTLRHRTGFDLPAWLTPEYITRRNGLIEQANIGEVYPKHLESLLLSDTPDTQERQRLYAEYLRLQLPLLALELSLKKENGVTARGARYVAALMNRLSVDRQVDGQTVVIRHLGFLREKEAVPDIVSNMFIIESDSMERGPHLLYRPFYAHPLIEFTTRATLMSAIAEPGALQDSVLTWLSDSARPIYTNGGFKEPHIVRFGVGDEFAPLSVPEPAQLATNGASNELLLYLLNGQLMLSLYGSNARALIDQAEAASVSNSESRWGIFLEGGGLIFNSLMQLPGLPRPLMLAGWLLGLAQSAIGDIPALESHDSNERELALVDVLINVGQLLLHLAPKGNPERLPALKQLKQSAVRPFAPPRVAEEWPEPPPPRIHEGAVALPGEFPNSESTILDFSFASARNRLTPSQRERLVALQITRPTPFPPAQANGAAKGLYSIQGKWHVLIDTALFFEVELQPEGHATIVSPTGIRHRGPNVRADANGNWSLDLGLRLHGGMPPKRIAAFKQQKQTRINELKATLEAFFDQEKPLHDNLRTTQAIYLHASKDPRFTIEQLTQFRDKFQAAIARQQTALQELLDSINERSELHIPFSEQVVISLLEKAFDNRAAALFGLASEQRVIARQWPQFTTPGPAQEVAAHNAPQEFLHFIKVQIELNERAVDYLDTRNSFIERLNNLSNAGVEAANKLIESLSAEEHSSLALKSFLLNCLKLASSKSGAGIKVESSLDNAIDPLKEYVQTHNQLNTLELEPGKRLEVLDSVVEHYGHALDALQGIELINRDELDIDYFNKLRQLLTDLYKEATGQLAAEIKPPAKPRKKTRKRTPSVTGKPQRKVINARGKGSLIGSVLPAGGEWPIEVIEIRAEYDNKLLSTYAQHGEEWVEIQASRPAAPIVKRMLDVVKGQARKLYAMFEHIKRRAARYKRQVRHPEEIEEILSHEASKFDKLADELNAALQEKPETDRLPADQMLVNDMHSAAQQLDQTGKALRLQLCLELPPTQGNLQYLLDGRRVQIAGLRGRVQLTGERRDYIQEFSISEPGKPPLWYAHFHYEHATTPKENYTVAHLKTKEQRKLSYFSQLNTAQSEQAIVNVHRGQIGKNMAERWFLPLAH